MGAQMYVLSTWSMVLQSAENLFNILPRGVVSKNLKWGNEWENHTTHTKLVLNFFSVFHKLCTVLQTQGSKSTNMAKFLMFPHKHSFPNKTAILTIPNNNKRLLSCLYCPTYVNHMITFAFTFAILSSSSLWKMQAKLNPKFWLFPENKNA